MQRSYSSALWSEFFSFLTHSSKPSIVLAVSGGSDSMALLQLYCEAKTQNSALPKPVVVTIDHGLRSGVDAEIALVAKFCASRAIPHNVVKWQGEKPKSGLMAKARIARYQLLSGAARKFDADMILTGHTFDDQQETLWMRRQRNADHASAMEQMVLFERKALIARPLLSEKRADLRAYLVSKNIQWADDPSNKNSNFERIRARDALEKIMPINIATQQASSLGMQAADCIARYFAALDESTVGFCISYEALESISDEALVLAMRYGIAVLGDLDYAPSPQSGQILLELVKCGLNGKAFTVGHCVATRTRSGLKIIREKRHLDTFIDDATDKLRPFEQFLPQSRYEMANALAEMLGRPPFVWPHGID